MAWSMGLLGASLPSVAAGAYDLLQTQVLSSPVTSITFDSLDSIAADYEHLQIRFVAKSTVVGNSTGLACVLNGDTTDSYRGHILAGDGTAVSSSELVFTGLANLGQVQRTQSGVPGSFTAGVIDILDFSNANKNTTLRNFSGHYAGNTRIQLTSGGYFKTDSVTSIKLELLAPDFATGSRFSLYGVK